MIGAFAVIILTATVLSLPAALLDRDRRIIAVAAVYATVMCLLGTVSGELAGAMLLAYFPLLTAVTIQAVRRRARRKAQHARAVAEGWDWETA